MAVALDPDMSALAAVRDHRHAEARLSLRRSSLAVMQVVIHLRISIACLILSIRRGGGDGRREAGIV